MLQQLWRTWRTSRPRPEADDLAAYVRQGRRPWSRGYIAFKERFIAEHIQDEEFLEALAEQQPLPLGYGEFLDERVVELPWLLSRLQDKPGRLLDAGSSTNHGYLLDHGRLRHKTISIVTLAPESQCHWQRGISYLFADLRDLPFRDDYFDDVACISTLEHVGKDNARLYASARYQENRGTDFLLAVRELKRVCRQGGRVLLTVPFGRYTDFGWYQQFDAALLEQLLVAFRPARFAETYFRYADGGWQVSTRADCANCEGFDIHQTRYLNPDSTRDYDPDFAAASRGIAALELWKDARP